MNWDIEATLVLVEKRFGRSQRQAANICIRSSDQRLRYARFHYHAIDDELEAFRVKLGSRHLLEAIAGRSEEETDDYYEFMDRVGAHAVACVQSIHATQDLLAAAVFQCLNLNARGKPLHEHQLSLPNTVERLKLDGRFATVQALLEGLQANQAFAHVDALSNKSKHSAVVRPWLGQDQTGTRASLLEFHFEEFTRKGVAYSEVSFRDVLEPAFELASKTQVDIGNELTRVLT